MRLIVDMEMTKTTHTSLVDLEMTPRAKLSVAEPSLHRFYPPRHQEGFFRCHDWPQTEVNEAILAARSALREMNSRLTKLPCYAEPTNDAKRSISSQLGPFSFHYQSKQSPTSPPTL